MPLAVCLWQKGFFMKKNDFRKMKKVATPLSAIGAIVVGSRLLRSWYNQGMNTPEISPVLVVLLIVFVIISIVLLLTKDETKSSESSNGKKHDEEKKCGFEFGYYKDWQGGFSFDTVTIGNQEWMAEDFEGEEVKHPYLHKEVALPDGWRIPSQQDFQDLRDYLMSQYKSEKDVVRFIEKNWYRGSLDDDACKNCEGQGLINNPVGGVVECMECHGTGIAHGMDICKLYWTNDQNKDDSIVCMYLQKSEIGFYSVKEDAIAHLRLIRSC